MRRASILWLFSLMLLSAGAPAAGAECGADTQVKLMHPSDLPTAARFGFQLHPLLNSNRWHSGLDYVGPQGSPVHAGAPGVVELAKYDGQYGNKVVIRHGPHFSTTYGHLQRVTVVVGACVEAGDVVGLLGSTGFVAGPQLHFEVLVGGEFVDPVVHLPRR